MALLCAVGVEVALGLLGELVEVGVFVFGGHVVWIVLVWRLRSGGYEDEGYLLKYWEEMVKCNGKIVYVVGFELFFYVRMIIWSFDVGATVL